MNSSSARRRLAAAACIALLALAGCSGSSSSDTATDQPRTTLTVFAAASLSTTFDGLEADFEKQHSDIDLRFNYAGSQDLVAQMAGGAPADVFASASMSWMETATEDGLIDGEADLFAKNTLQIAVAPGNPKQITGLETLTSGGLAVVRCASAVPCGALTDRMLEETGVRIPFTTEQNSVTDTLSLVRMGEADAAIVYRTDVTGSDGAVEGVEIEGAEAWETTYPIAVTSHARQSGTAADAQAFVDFVLGPTGQAALADAGFLAGE